MPLRQEHEPHREADFVVPRSYSAAAEQLESAREADAAWRAAHKARFARPLAWLLRWTGPLEVGLGLLAFAAVALMFLTVAFSPKPPGAARWESDRLAPYVNVIELCVVAFLVLAGAAVSVRWMSEQFQHRIRTQAAREAVDLDD